MPPRAAAAAVSAIADVHSHRRLAGRRSLGAVPSLFVVISTSVIVVVLQAHPIAQTMAAELKFCVSGIG
jgi:hypothetical protein